MAPITLGPLTITQADSKATIAISESAALGGGSVKGVISAQGEASVVVDELILISAGLAALVAKWPALAPEAGVLQGLVSAELSKL